MWVGSKFVNPNLFLYPTFSPSHIHLVYLYIMMGGRVKINLQNKFHFPKWPGSRFFCWEHYDCCFYDDFYLNLSERKYYFSGGVDIFLIKCGRSVFVRSLRSRMGLVIAPEQQQSQPHKNYAASHNIINIIDYCLNQFFPWKGSLK